MPRGVGFTGFTLLYLVFQDMSWVTVFLFNQELRRQWLEADLMMIARKWKQNKIVLDGRNFPTEKRSRSYSHSDSIPW
jgi:hypothetical protein